MSRHHKKNKKKKFEPIAGEFTYEVVSKLTIESKPEKGVSSVKEIKVMLQHNYPFKVSWKDDDGNLNADGLRASTQGLIQGLISNIHVGHQKGLRDSAEHLRYIIEYLQKGFVAQVDANFIKNENHE